jgi:hypothetical protein
MGGTLVQLPIVFFPPGFVSGSTPALHAWSGEKMSTREVVARITKLRTGVSPLKALRKNLEHRSSG